MEIVRHYKTLLSQPSVGRADVLDLRDGAWLGAPGGMVRGDFSRKPSYDAVHALIKGEWWLQPTPMTTDSQGRLRFSGFLGDYEVTAGDRRAAFKLGREGRRRGRSRPARLRPPALASSVLA